MPEVNQVEVGKVEVGKVEVQERTYVRSWTSGM